MNKRTRNKFEKYDDDQIRSICMFCKKVLKMNKKEPALISHGLCKKCANEHYPEESD